MDKTINAKRIALKVSIIAIIVNVILMAIKFVAGIVGHSGAMFSDAIHTASDILTTLMVIVGVNISSKKPDEKHPYGHERFECVTSVLLAVLLAITGFIVGYDGIEKIVTGAYLSAQKPTLLALIAAVLSIATKEGMYWFTVINAKKINSISLKADAWHHRSDAISSVGSLIGVAGAMLGVMILDTIASLVICLLILKVAFDVFMEAINKMVDKACDEKIIKEFNKTIAETDGVLTVDEIKTRMFGNRIYVDIEIGVYKNLTLEVAHRIAEKVHDKIEEVYPDVKHCTVHVNPIDIEFLDEQVLAEKDDQIKYY